MPRTSHKVRPRPSPGAWAFDKENEVADDRLAASSITFVVGTGIPVNSDHKGPYLHVERHAITNALGLTKLVRGGWTGTISSLFSKALLLVSWVVHT